MPRKTTTDPLDPRGYLTGFEVGAVVGRDSALSPIDVWRLKRGEITRYPAPRSMGMEPAYRTFMSKRLMLEWRLRHHTKTRKIRRVYLMQEPRWAVAHPGYLTPGRAGKRYGLDAFVVPMSEASEWPQGGRPERLPRRILARARWNAMICDCAGWWVVAWLGGEEYREWLIRHDEDKALVLFGQAYNFWHTCVLGGEMPTPAPLDTATLTALFPTHGEEVLYADARVAEAISELRQARRDQRDATARERALKNELMAAIGDAAGVRSDDGAVLWTRTEGETVTDWEAVARELMGQMGRAERAQLLDRHGKAVEGGRKLVLPEEWD